MKKTLVSFLALSLCLTGGISAYQAGTAQPKSAEAYSASVQTQEEILSEYFIGTDFSVPQGTLTYDGKEYVADGTALKMPDGRVYSGSTYVLDQAGKYTVTYSTKIDGGYLEAEKTFFVKENMYEVTSRSSKVEYVEALSKVTTGTVGGLSVTLTEGDEFRFNQPIDLSAGAGSFEFIKIYPNSLSDIAEMGKDGVEANYITITLTDCYDDKKYIDFVVAYCSTGSNSQPVMPYFRAGALGQSVTGLDKNANKVVDNITQKEIFIDGDRYISRYDDKYGTLGAKTADNVGYAFAYDPLSTRVTVDDGEVNIVNVLNDVDIYGDTLFEGFTTGEVFLSVKGREYVSSELNFEIESIGGLKGEGLKNGLISDKQAPMVDVDVEVPESGKINIACNERFEVFSASATDRNLVGGVKVGVYYNYGTKMQTQVGLSGGGFIPRRAGVYTVVYTAKDSAGNVTKELVPLQCASVDGDKAIAFNTEKIAALKAGEETVLPSYTVSGINGDVTVEIKALCKDEIVEIDGETRAFTPKQIGEYTIVYRYYDEISEYEYSYVVNSEASDAVIANSELYLPEYFIKGASYSFDEVAAYVYGQGVREEKAAKLYVSEDGGEYKEISFDEYLVGANQTVQFKLVYGEKTLVESELICVVETKRGEELLVENYFQGEFEVEEKEDAISYRSKTQTGDNVLRFISPISLSNFIFDFKVLAAYGNFSSLKVELVDYYDRNASFAFTYLNKTSTYDLTASGGYAYSVHQSFVDAVHSISYQKQTDNFVVSNTGKSRTIANAVSFKTDKVLLKITVEGINGDSAIDVRQVGNQAFTVSVTADNSLPMVSYRSSAGRYLKNSTVTIYPIEATDVLSTVLNKNITLTVQSRNGDYLTSLDGVRLDGTCLATREYQVKLTEYERYTVRYTVVDGNGKFSPDTYFMTVTDSESPTITLDKGYGADTVVNAKIGDKIKIVSYTVSDDYSATDKLKTFVSVIDPNYAIEVLEGNSFVAKMKGTYKICYYCYDETGNLSMQYYTVKVQ